MIGIIEYDMGNTQSVMNAFEYVGANAKIVRDPDGLSECGSVVLPGVGAFGLGMKSLRNKGFLDALERNVMMDKKPFLGICLGMQLICRESYEFGHHKGLGWLDASVRRLPGGNGINVPHVGWNSIRVVRDNRLTGSNKDQDVYFVHSYYVDAAPGDHTVATCSHGIEFAAVIEKDNIYAAQFHPEKSQSNGLSILRRFTEIS